MKFIINPSIELVNGGPLYPLCWSKAATVTISGRNSLCGHYKFPYIFLYLDPPLPPPLSAVGPADFPASYCYSAVFYGSVGLHVWAWRTTVCLSSTDVEWSVTRSYDTFLNTAPNKLAVCLVCKIEVGVRVSACASNFFPFYICPRPTEQEQEAGPYMEAAGTFLEVPIRLWRHARVRLLTLKLLTCVAPTTRLRRLSLKQNSGTLDRRRLIFLSFPAEVVPRFVRGGTGDGADWILVLRGHSWPGVWGYSASLKILRRRDVGKFKLKLKFGGESLLFSLSCGVVSSSGTPDCFIILCRRLSGPLTLNVESQIVTYLSLCGQESVYTRHLKAFDTIQRLDNTIRVQISSLFHALLLRRRWLYFTRTRGRW